MHLSSIHIYPIKSLGGISLQTAQVEARGLQYDRRWMLIDQDNVFISQRTKPALALIDVALGENGFIVSHRTRTNLAPLHLPFSINEGERLEVQLFDETCEGLLYNESGWFQAAVDLDCRLVYMPDDSERLVDGKYAHNKEITSYSDGFPFLLIGMGSLVALNQRLENPVPMNRFRPNLVFSGGTPFQEDTFAKLKIGTVTFLAPKPCGRCVMTTVNQETGKKDLSRDPLKTLATFRTWNNKVLFGENLLAANLGEVKVGEKLVVLENKVSCLP